ncbi:hypothetical protein AAG906_037263 [Vitis piasezkii]
MAPLPGKVLLHFMENQPEDQHSQHGQGNDPNLYRSMRDRMHPPRMSAPSCIIPPEQLIIRPHIVPRFLLSMEWKDKAKIWLNSLRPRSIRTWTELQADFLKKFFPTHRTNGLKRQISNFSAPILETMCGGDFMSKNPEEAMDFLSYVSEVSRGWDEPNSREMGKRPVQQMSRGDVDWRNHPNFAWKPRPNPYQSPAQSSQQSQGQSSVEQALVSLSKVMGDFVSEQKSINSQLNQKIDNVESTLNKKIDGMHNELSQKIDNIQYSISRLTNLNINEKGMESKDEDSSKVRDVQAIITLRSGKEVHHRSMIEESQRRQGKEVQMKESIIPSMDEEPQILLKEGMMKKHMPPPFPQALRGKKPIKNASEILDVLRQVKELGLGELKPTSITLSLADRSVKIPRGVIEDVLVQVDKFYYPVDFVVLDTDPIVKGINYVPIILGRPFLATSNAIINCRNGVMQLTFGNMTLELNIFHLCQKHIHPEEDEGPEEVCMIDTLVEEHCNQNLDDGLAEPMGMNVVMSNWRQKPVILPLFKDEEEMKEAKDAILKLELKTLPAELKYAYLEEGNKAPVVISSSLTVSQEDNLLRILRKHKKAIGWQISDLKGISPLICTHHIYMEEELNPHMQEVVRAEVLKLLQAGIIYPISDSTWEAERMRKDHFPLPFMDQVLERVSGHPFYCFLDGYSGYFQIEIDVEDQEKTTFTCPFGTYAYRRMPFGLCNAPATFQRCMLSIFSDMVERIMEDCLSHLEDVLKRCIEKDLVLNWEKCHFMVNQGIVLGHVISKKGIEVDRAKVELIVKLPPPTNVKGIRQFLGHAGFYRRFIKDFSKIAKPLCELLVKDAKFEWDDKCQRSFELLKQFLTSAPIVRAPNWELPFEVMCDSSDYAIGAVLGQREDGKPYVIYYASKSLNDAQKNYTTTEKELLAWCMLWISSSLFDRVFHCGVHGSFSFEVFANQARCQG